MGLNEHEPGGGDNLPAGSLDEHSTRSDEQVHGFWVFLLIGVIGAFVTAFVFIAVIGASVPPTDLAYGQSVFATLNDSFVLAIAGPVAFFSGLLASPLLFFCLRRRRLAVALPLVFASVLATVALLTPFSQLLGWFGSYAALVASTVVCAQIQATARIEKPFDVAT